MTALTSHGLLARRPPGHPEHHLEHLAVFATCAVLCTRARLLGVARAVAISARCDALQLVRRVSIRRFLDWRWVPVGYVRRPIAIRDACVDLGVLVAVRAVVKCADLGEQARPAISTSR